VWSRRHGYEAGSERYCQQISPRASIQRRGEAHGPSVQVKTWEKPHPLTSDSASFLDFIAMMEFSLSLVDGQVLKRIFMSDAVAVDSDAQ
jgi:hypothetical protein